MKQPLFFALSISAILFFQSCGSEKIENKQLSEYISYRDSLKTELNKISELIAETELKIAALDTNVAATVVTLDSVQNIAFEHYFEVHGNVVAEENAAIFSEVPGVVKKIHVKEGQNVNKGDVLITLDAAPMEAAIKELDKAYSLAKDVYERQAKLWEQKIGSEMQYLQAKNNKESLEQKIKTTKTQLAMYQIKAPFSGIVEEIKPKVGEAAAPGFPVARVMNLGAIYLNADVSENYLGKIKEGTSVKVFFPAINKEISATIERVGEFINSANRTFKVRVVINNEGNQFKPNLLAVLKIRDFVDEKAQVVPSNIIQQDRSGQNYIYKLEGNTVKKVVIQTGMSYEGKTQVVQGLEEVSSFIDKGARRVKEGDVVEIEVVK